MAITRVVNHQSTHIPRRRIATLFIIALNGSVTEPENKIANHLCQHHINNAWSAPFLASGRESEQILAS